MALGPLGEIPDRPIGTGVARDIQPMLDGDQTTHLTVWKEGKPQGLTRKDELLSAVALKSLALGKELDK